MKAKDLILTINEFVNSNELSSLAGSSAFQDVDVQDDTIEEVKKKLSGLMSQEAAINNHELESHFKKKLYPTIKGELLGNIDTDLIKTAKELLGDDIINQFEGIDYTGDKIKKFAEITKTVLAQKSTDPKLKETLEQQKQQFEEKYKTFQTDLSKKDEEINKIKQDFENKLIQKEFNSVMSTYKLGEKFQDDFIKESLSNKMFQEVNKKAKLSLNENGSIIPRNPENPELELFEGNKKIESIKQILDPLMTDYIVKKPEGGKQKDVYNKAPETKMGSLAADLLRKRNQQEQNFI